MEMNMKTRYSIQLIASILLISLSLYGCGGGGGNNSQTETNNTAPEIEGNSPDYVRVGQTYTFTPTARDTDNDPLFFTVENKPDWASFDINTGELSGTPSDTDVQIYSNITITANDGSAATSTAPFVIKTI